MAFEAITIGRRNNNTANCQIAIIIITDRQITNDTAEIVASSNRNIQSLYEIDPVKVFVTSLTGDLAGYYDNMAVQLTCNHSGIWNKVMCMSVCVYICLCVCPSCVCLLTCMSVCVYVCMHICGRVCVVCVCMCACMCVCMRVCVVCLRVCVCVCCMSACVCVVYMCTCMCMCMCVIQLHVYI